jgi:hypothetical protein
MESYAAQRFTQPFLAASNSPFLESVYLVNEFFGNEQVEYSVANWWITVEKMEY